MQLDIAFIFSGLTRCSSGARSLTRSISPKVRPRSSGWHVAGGKSYESGIIHSVSESYVLRSAQRLDSDWYGSLKG